GEEVRPRTSGPRGRRGGLPHQRAHRRAPGARARRAGARRRPRDAPPAAGARAAPARGDAPERERERVSARSAQRGRGVLRALAVLVLLALAVLGAGWLWLSNLYGAPGPASEASRIEVAPGTSLRAVLAALEARGTLRSARAVEWYLRLRGLRVRVETGTYEIPAHASPREILALFAEGKVVLEQLTVVEGATFGEFLDALAADPHVTHTLAGKSPGERMAAIGHPGVAPEGQFFPDTYRFAAHTTDAAILTLAYDAMQSALAAAWAQRAADLPLAGPYQALILASMIEKEAQLKSERARIAG